MRPTALELREALRGYQETVDDFDRELARLLTVNRSDLHCLDVLLEDSSRDAVGPGELARRLRLTSGAISTMLNRLELARFIVREIDPTDRRKMLVRATPEAASRRSALIAPLYAEAAEQVASLYTAEEIDRLLDLIRHAQELQERHVERLRSTLKPPPE